MAKRPGQTLRSEDIDAGLRALQKLEPAGLSAEGLGWQQRKSAQTRVAILEATIDSLERYGYAGTTTQTIGELANISRGAMMHHYSTKQDLIASVIDYTFYKRLEWTTSRITQLSEQERVKKLGGVEVTWQSYFSREYTAYRELDVAARTDPALKAIFLPKARRFDAIYMEEMRRLHPEWTDTATYELAIDFGRSAIEGLAANLAAWGPERVAQARKIRDTIVVMLREGLLQLPDAGARASANIGTRAPARSQAKTNTPTRRKAAPRG